ncbi:MAG: trigger factor [Anaerolineae bacterium]
MKVTTEALERCETLLTVEIDPKQEQNLLQKAAKKIARQVRIPGFRPGKAPYSVVVRRFGLETLQQEVLEDSVDKLVQDALAETSITPYAQISLDGVDWEPLTIKVKIPTEPQVELGNYRDIRLEAEPVEITDEDVQNHLEQIQQQNALWSPVERPAEIGDMVDMAVVEKEGDTLISERESVEYELEDPTEHEGHNHPDLTTPLLGITAGEERSFTLTYPEEFDNESYAGKEITFEVKANSVKEKEVDPIDDEFAKAFSDFETLDEFKADIRENLLKDRTRQQAQQLGSEAIDKILEEATVLWPQALEDESVERELRGFEREMNRYGLNLDTYFQMGQTTKEAFIEETRERVVKQLQRSLVLGKVAELEKLTVGEGEILERAKLIADLSRGGEQMWRNILASPSQQAMIADELLADKAINRLAAIARGENPTVEEEVAEAEEAAEVAEEAEAAAEETVEAEAAAVVAGETIEETEETEQA